jgi:uncharacterized protein with von Willebrand factor type A (vWA) domain
VDASDPEQARWALRVALCSRREDLVLFDAAFAAWADPVAGAGASAAELLAELGPLALPRAAVPGEPEAAPEAGLEAVPAAWSELELLREKDFAELSDAERATARRVLERLARRGPRRPGRRLRPARPRGSHPDLRRTVRASLRHAGEPFERHWRSPSERPRPLVLVCDVSGSMEPYARVLLQYLQACVGARRQAEAFVFGTRLTRVTRELAGRDPDAALERAAAAVQDWSGGTRIGTALAQLNREHGRRLGRGAVVVILSDGWDRGDPEQLDAEMARLRRCSHRVVWLNPLKASPGYEPLARGMSAALPHVDHFMAGNTLASLERLAGLLEAGFAAGAPGAEERR